MSSLRSGSSSVSDSRDQAHVYRNGDVPEVSLITVGSIISKELMIVCYSLCYFATVGNPFPPSGKIVIYPTLQMDKDKRVSLLCKPISNDAAAFR